MEEWQQHGGKRIKTGRSHGTLESSNFTNEEDGRQKWKLSFFSLDIEECECGNVQLLEHIQWQCPLLEGVRGTTIKRRGTGKLGIEQKGI